MPSSRSGKLSDWKLQVLTGEIQREDSEKVEIDYFSDASLQKFLDNDHMLTKGYVPADLEPINSVFTSNNSKNFKLRREAGIQFADLARAFSNAFDFKVKLSLVSARRSAESQKILRASCASARCADVGASEHEAGLALDIGINGGNILRNGEIYYNWLHENAHKRGFHQSYQKGLEIDGKMEEPRHWRYVGTGLATLLHERDLSFTEYFYSLYPKPDEQEREKNTDN